MLCCRGYDHTVIASDDSDYVSVGPRKYLDRFRQEFGLTPDDMRGKVISRPTFSLRGERGEDDWLVHESLLRSCGEFHCAGDAEALSFCREIVNEMVVNLGVPQAEAVARVNRQWPQSDPGEKTRRTWIVGLSIAYHEEPAFWAGQIYFGPGTYWWDPAGTPTPLPPPA